MRRLGWRCATSSRNICMQCVSTWGRISESSCPVCTHGRAGAGVPVGQHGSAQWAHGRGHPQQRHMSLMRPNRASSWNIRLIGAWSGQCTPSWTSAGEVFFHSSCASGSPCGWRLCGARLRQPCRRSKLQTEDSAIGRPSRACRRRRSRQQESGCAADTSTAPSGQSLAWSAQGSIRDPAAAPQPALASTAQPSAPEQAPRAPTPSCPPPRRSRHACLVHGRMT